MKSKLIELDTGHVRNREPGNVELLMRMEEKHDEAQIRQGGGGK